jgi:predicted methyltransferase
MHRSKHIDPLTDAELKARLIIRPNDTILDTCGGLGYSAMFALKAGANKVISTEKSESVIKIRQLNPWITPLHENERLDFIHADILKKILTFESDLFGGVIHDPPRFTSATGDLYGKKFYAELYRVMVPKGRLFHYTGNPKKIKSQDTFIKNSMNRLENAGFKAICFKKQLQGIYAEKN